ncbi:MAG TPA: ABC transporter ATP-binding protein [Candidatus Ventrousia excrementavium]|uniref:ABC transporter ATP-binding protein n=1 Tax=Candidatus Ventrousia excrementavium TaxID=2840961 RepID=A0A9D1IT08_9CLOT|nr:ABC transporter ATP-binding protein [Candidatus Ventrousia excrementavium]
MGEKLLQVKNLSTYFYTDEGIVYALDDVSFDLGRGEALGIVGESGSGKSVTALSIIRLVQSPPGKIVAGEVLLDGEDLLKKSKAEMRHIRGEKVSMIFQEPMTALNPVFTVGRQIMESILIHQHKTKKEAREQAIEMLRLVGIPAPEKRIDDYPHQMSGGMRQRVMIAIALCCNPQLLICDEPTTALDVTIQAQILELIRDIRERLGTSVILITHDLGVVAQVTDKVIIMYAGKVMEYGTVRQIFTDPLHPYTAALMRSIPVIGKKTERLNVIRGMVPSLSKRPEGCLFHPRCDEACDLCRTVRPELTDMPGGRQVRCHKYTDKWEETSHD